MSEPEEVPTLVERTQKTLASLGLSDEDAAVAEFALVLAEIIDGSAGEKKPIDLNDPKWRGPAGKAMLVRRIRILERHEAWVYTMERVGPQYLATMRELGGTPGARQRAAGPVAGGVSNAPSELDEFRAARRAG